MIFGTTSTGDDVAQLTIASGDLTVSLLTWGAIVQDVRLAGIDRSLTLGSDSIADYESDMRHHGSLIGPIANRISTARVLIDGMMYELERNQDGAIHLHSGAQATHRRNWEVLASSPTEVTLRCILIDGACGLPGNREITATFAVSKPATLTLTVTGKTDAPTLMNFANHSYWNFDGTDTWDGHRLQIHADSFLPATPQNYPTGEIADVEDTAMDFRQLRQISPENPPLDNNFCLSGSRGPVRDVLTLQGSSGVGMTVATDQPGIQIYDGRDAMRPARANYEGLAIEAQGWPDAPNNPTFPSIRVTPDTPYQQTTRFSFYKSAKPPTPNA
ncbi:aldose 1-epimerase [Cognatiyoonia koreensis]|uniref:Aldose 1-epimerase n=1 Tax=Cognatiyoonia koreensis TaxID=364200 RepID=A0A1I0RAW9_9RHOB|nr:aldose epimerase family protein [Cognatiyoonia koreensis]SEW37943.1 aldose 1-epimerase [Cognatiyoonia koreensis]